MLAFFILFAVIAFFVVRYYDLNFRTLLTLFYALLLLGILTLLYSLKANQNPQSAIQTNNGANDAVQGLIGFFGIAVVGVAAEIGRNLFRIKVPISRTQRMLGIFSILVATLLVAGCVGLFVYLFIVWR